MTEVYLMSMPIGLSRQATVLCSLCCFQTFCSVIQKKELKVTAKRLSLCHCHPLTKTRPCPWCEWPVDGPDLFDRNDTLKPGTWCQSGEEDGANPDTAQIAFVASRSLLQEFLGILSQICCVVLFHS